MCCFLCYSDRYNKCIIWFWWCSDSTKEWKKATIMCSISYSISIYRWGMPLVSCTTEWLFTYFKLPQNYDDVVFVSLEYVGTWEWKGEMSSVCIIEIIIIGVRSEFKGVVLALLNQTLVSLFFRFKVWIIIGNRFDRSNSYLTFL